MAARLTQYSCDTCRSRKVACSRHLSGCQRCKAEGIACYYSRAGVIRRSRKQKNKNSLSTPHSETPGNTEPRGLPPPGRLASDNDVSTTQERLRGLVGKDCHSLRALASLLEEYAAAWQGSSAFDELAEGAEADFFRFEEDQVRAWVDAFIATLQKERLLLTSAPSEVLDHLDASHPHQVHDRAWLVMFYSVALSVVSSTNPSDQSTKAKLRSNLWLALNDVKLLLEPNASSIQALVILACHVEEFMTPSLCWALITKACIMLQALGIAHWRLDPLTRERRTLLFWRLNLLDKALALILCRPPAFHREMATMIALPTLDQLLPSQPHLPSCGAPVLFNAHYTQQMLLLSRVMADVWHCLYGQSSDEANAMKENLESWYRQASEVLEAAALAEKPLLSASGAASVDLGLRTLRFHYHSLLVLLMVSCKQLRTQCTYPSQQMLRLLPSLGDMLLGLKKPDTCLLWQRLHCPLAAFGALWGEIVTRGKTHLEQSKQSLEAIEHLPAYFGKLSSRNSLAAKLENITERIVRHARSILYSQEDVDEIARNPSTSTQETANSRRSGADNLEQHSNPPIALLNPALPTSVPNTSGHEDFDAQQDGLFTWSDDGFFDTTFDWFAWTNQEVD